jgi:23S rRNA (uracil1939-C5)-methyltransferase
LHTTPITYDVHSFFQVNLDVFEQALERIELANASAESCVDMYSGVGTIGLSIGDGNILVESDPRNCVMARENAKDGKGQVVEAAAEQALDYIDATKLLVVDPPRAGLHADVIERIRSVQPVTVAYLSCNPITQARDLALLQDIYSVEVLEGYNFFPRTPHIESLAILARKR